MLVPHLIAGGLTATSLAALGLCLWRGHRDKDTYLNMWKGVYVAGSLVSACAVVVTGLIFTINLYGPHYSERACARWGAATERETRFIHPTYWSWDCVVRTDEGWVSTSAIVKVDD
jgi:hypothetical protein